MLSADELNDGMPFILTMSQTDGTQRQWIETLQGETARRWYDLYRTSDWDAVRAAAPDVFRHDATAEELEALRKSRRRCIFIRMR